MPPAPAHQEAVVLDGIAYRYEAGGRPVLDDVSFSVAAGEVFGLLGPNGSGKTTLFRLLCTLLPVQGGRGTIFGHDLQTDPIAVRRSIGVTFQSPSLDRHLSVAENLSTQARIYGLDRQTAARRVAAVMERLRIADRARTLAGALSGGLRRRVEIAKSLLHEPRLLLLDEPSTGLDPGARIDLWQYLTTLARESGITILATTHLMDEADRADRLAILSRGRLVALGTPDALRDSIGGDCLTVQAESPRELAERIGERFDVSPRVIGDAIRIEAANGHELAGELARAFPGAIRRVTFGQPTLEDVFIQRTGHRFWDEEGQDSPPDPQTRRS